jgi:hypothetical protein
MWADTAFRAANLAALLAWSALIVLPRGAVVRRWIVGAVVAGICVAYATLVSVFLFPSGGSFFSFAGVQQLFSSPPVLLAGWLHYLAFDLFIGWWLAGRMDARGVSRLLQAPLLVTTFMFGPVGLLLGGAVLLAIRRSGTGVRLERAWTTP